jgi:hypothetical protein
VRRPETYLIGSRVCAAWCRACFAAIDNLFKPGTGAVLRIHK